MSKDHFDLLWNALQNGDPEAFPKQALYGVRTTGIYCKPGCPSRMPLKKNTVFLVELIVLLLPVTDHVKGANLVFKNNVRFTNFGKFVGMW